VQLRNHLLTFIRHGLQSEEAAERLSKDGPNAVEGTEGLSLWKILLRQISNSLTLVLIIVLALSFGIHDYIEGSVVAAVIVLNVVVGFVQDYKAEKQIAALLALSAPEAKVVRDETLMTVQAEKLVVGDVVHLSVGDIVPADLRLIDGINLSMDEALLTGESMNILKKSHLTYGSDLEMAIGDRKNMAYSGSSVTQGRGVGFIVAIGMSTEVGKIAELLKNKAPERHSNFFIRTWQNFVAQAKVILGLVGTPLTVSLSKFALLLFALAITLTIIVFSANKWDISEEVLIYGICVAVAVIPESLIAVLTITVAVGTKAMAKGNVIVRKLSSLEAVGGVTNICSDKTGTLTQGKMVATKAWIPGQGTLEVFESSHPYDPSSGVIKLDGLSQPEKAENPLTRLLQAMALCNLATVFNASSSIGSKSNDSFISIDKDPEWKASGEPTEIALQVLAMRFGLGKLAILSQGNLEFVAEFPFSNKRMTTIYRDSTGGLHAFVKGATEVLLEFVQVSDLLKGEIKAVADEYAGQGLRVLSIGYRNLTGTQLTFELSDRPMVETELEFLGLVGIHDPPRPESAEAVRRCKLAGIEVHMLTGDHPATATAIAQSVGILNELSVAKNKSAVMSAHDFDKLSNAELDNMEYLPLVVARCSPSTKVRMVEAMHRRGAFCVMTGDGVNDSPALKIADVGIAMGLNGSDVAKQAADMVLTDDNFASIVKAIEEGRRLFDNIQKVRLS
jgi:Na+-exporting ATPase